MTERVNDSKKELEFKIVDSLEASSMIIHNQIVDFLHKYLDEYGDTKEDILKAVEYALSSFPYQGGFVLLAKESDNIKGAVVINKTNMSGYVPENILVYIAVHKEFRGKGVGKVLMEKALELAKGDVALHVEPENPAKYLYEKIGFTNKYLEMRYINK